jgi:hypothetical protein
VKPSEERDSFGLALCCGMHIVKDFAHLYLLCIFVAQAHIIQENADTLQRIMYELQKLNNNYNLNISTTKTKAMAFQGKYLIRLK